MAAGSLPVHQRGCAARRRVFTDLACFVRWVRSLLVKCGMDGEADRLTVARHAEG